MFRFPNIKPAPIASAAQLCVDCERWFDLSAAEIAALLKHWQLVQTEGAPFATCACRHCNKEQIAVLPGKYDKPNTPRERCSVQHVVLAGRVETKHGLRRGA